MSTLVIIVHSVDVNKKFKAISIELLNAVDISFNFSRPETNSEHTSEQTPKQRCQNREAFV